MMAEGVQRQSAHKGAKDESDHDKVDLIRAGSELPEPADSGFQAQHRGQEGRPKQGVTRSRKLRIHEETEQHQDGRDISGRGEAPELGRILAADPDCCDQSRKFPMTRLKVRVSQIGVKDNILGLE